MTTIRNLILLAMVACSGCTTVSLEQYTLNQNRSGGETRDRMIMDCLAAVAADPSVLPSFSVYSGGVTTVTDSVSIGLTNTWAPMKHTLEALALTGNRQPKGQWTADPVAEYQQLEALHAACLWVICGPEVARHAYDWILEDPRVLLDNKPHLGVVERLERVPPGWLHIGCEKEVPHGARFKGHSGHTWVWVMPGDTEPFAQFTLAIQSIATLDPTVLTAPPLVIQLQTFELTKLPDTVDGTKSATIATTQLRYVKPEHRADIENAINAGIKGGKVNLTRAQWMEYTTPYYGQRDSTGISTIGTATTSLGGRAAPTRLNPGVAEAPTSIAPPAAKFPLPPP